MASSEDIADRVEILRGLGEVSQRELSDLAGLSPSHIRKIERRDRPNFGVDAASAICDATGSTADWLIRGLGSPPAKRTVMRALALARKRAVVAAGI